MNRKLLAGALLAIGLCVVLVTFTTATPGDDSATETALRNLGYTVVPIRKTALNSYEVKGKLNGDKPLELILSFQAVNTIFNTKRLDEMGVKYESAGQKFEVNGDSDELYVVRTDSIQIGDGKLGAEEIMCVNFSEFEAFDQYRVGGILGRDFLIKYNALIDFANQKLYLKTK